MVVHVGELSLQIFLGVGSVTNWTQFLLVHKTHMIYQKKTKKSWLKKSSHTGLANQSMKLVNHNTAKQVLGNCQVNHLFQIVPTMHNQVVVTPTPVMMWLV
ncbi:Uncharacterised protein [Chlamydia trachomatis]|nr:Uncharacterised protein [Chlamydia trachomatis]